MLAMFAAGLMIGLLLDIVRIVRDRFHIQLWLKSLMDLLYWLLSAILVFYLLWWSNGGQLRFYVFVMIGSGFLLYLRFVSAQMQKILLRIVGFSERLVKTALFLLNRIIWRPIAKAFAILRSIVLGSLLIPYSITKNWFDKSREKK